MKKYQELENFLISFLKDEVKKAGFSKVVLGISGGIDSAVVAILAQKAFKERFLGLVLPSSTTSSQSLKDADELCKLFDIHTQTISIANLVESYFENFKDASRLRVGNFTSRMRMATLYDISARENALVLGTSNKSELLLGYGTIYGDMACAINPLGELYKTEVFEFAIHLGVPESIVKKAPSADLWENQSDEDEFGFSYAQIDKVLYAHIEQKREKEALLDLGFDGKLVEMVLGRTRQNAFKGKLPTIADISALKLKEQ